MPRRVLSFTTPLRAEGQPHRLALRSARRCGCPSARSGVVKLRATAAPAVIPPRMSGGTSTVNAAWRALRPIPGRWGVPGHHRSPSGPRPRRPGVLPGLTNGQPAPRYAPSWRRAAPPRARTRRNRAVVGQFVVVRMTPGMTATWRPIVTDAVVTAPAPEVAFPAPTAGGISEGTRPGG